MSADIYSMAWTADGYDFNAVNLVSTELAKRYNRSLSAITLSITLTLLFRSLGALIIGMLADMFGRKWPLVINLWILAVLQIATAYAPTYGAFIGVRTLFGIFMGGIWGLAAAISLENMPVEARGLFSGLLQQGYALGYLIAAGINLGAVPKTSVGYQIIFFVGAGFTALVAIAALVIPESPIYREQRASAKARYPLFWKDFRLAARMYWRMFLYLHSAMHGLQLDEPRSPRRLPELPQSAERTGQRQRQHRDYGRPVWGCRWWLHLRLLLTVLGAAVNRRRGLLFWPRNDSALDDPLLVRCLGRGGVLPPVRSEWRLGCDAHSLERIRASAVQGRLPRHSIPAGEHVVSARGGDSDGVRVSLDRKREAELFASDDDCHVYCVHGGRGDYGLWPGEVGVAL